MVWEPVAFIWKQVKITMLNPFELDFRTILAPTAWVFAAVDFRGQMLQNSLQTSLRYPEPGYNLFTVRDLLLLCDPTPVRFEEQYLEMRGPMPFATSTRIFWFLVVRPGATSSDVLRYERRVLCS